MRKSAVAPTGQERTFAAEDIIVSKTDLQGRLTYANEVFLDVSKYRRSELIGQPHSIVRHPDMPRGLFHLLWETISAGDEVFAYIDNLAADGASYWVLAHVTPTFDRTGRVIGYHSNRRLPERGPIDRIREVYARMRAVESRYTNSREAAAASAAMVRDELAEAGQSYERFVWQLISGRDVTCV